MNKYLKLVTLIVLSSASIEVSASENENKYDGYYWSSDNYVGVSLGLNLTDEQNYSYTDGGVTLVNLRNEYETSLSGSLYWGFESQLINQFGWRPELEYSYKKSDLSGIFFGDDTTYVDHASGDLSSHNFMANFYYDFTNKSSYTPYLGFGLGYSMIDFDIQGNPVPVTVIIDQDNQFAYQAALGFNYEMSEKQDLFFDYRYFSTLKPTITTSQGDTQKINYGIHSFNIGLKYKF